MRHLIAAVVALLTLSATAAADTIPVPPGTDASYDAAYKAASSGDVLELTTGQYGTWTVPGGTKQITVKAAVGARPVFKQIANYGNCAPNDGSPGADNITFDGLRIDAGGQRPPVGFCALFENGEHSNVTFKNGYIGNTVDQKGAVLGGRNAVIDNTRFGDVRPVGSQVHNECVWASSEGQKITNNYFEGVCGNTGPLVMTGGPGVQTMEFSGNTFEPQLFNHGAIIFGSACGGIGSNCAGITMRNNTFLPGTNPYNNPTDHTFNGSVESCNTPANAFAGLPGITHEACGEPTPTATSTPTPTPTPEPTPTPTPEPTPEPTPDPEPYSPACAPTCDEQIAHLKADIAAHEATIAGLQAELAETRDWRERWKARAQTAEGKLDRIAAILAE